MSNPALLYSSYWYVYHHTIVIHCLIQNDFVFVVWCWILNGLPLGMLCFDFPYHGCKKN
jgi:hypothetical protein